jgi:hypothetical protein
MFEKSLVKFRAYNDVNNLALKMLLILWLSPINRGR